MDRGNNPRPVSPAPWFAPHQGDGGTPYGFQGGRTIEQGDTKAQVAIDVQQAESLWRFSITGGDLLVDVTFGTLATRSIRNLRAPVVMTVPGKLTVEVRSNDTNAAQPYKATLTAATAGASQARRPVDAGGGPAVPLDVDAARFTALAACTLTVGGLAVTLAASEVVPLIAPSVLLTGRGFEEFEA